MAANDVPYSKDFTVAVVGGGMVGLLCAATLNRAGIHVDVYEAAGKFSEIGSGVALGHNAIHVVKALGMYEALIQALNGIDPTMQRFHYIEGSGSHEYLFEYEKGAFGISILRPVFIQVMLSLLDPNICHLNKCYTGVSRDQGSGTYRISFKDGGSATADLVIGADGIRSLVRTDVLGHTQRAAFMHTRAYRGLIPLQKLRDGGLKTDLGRGPCCFVGRNHHIIAFPLLGGKLANLVLFSAEYDKTPGSIEIPKEKWVEEASEDTVVQEFSSFGPDVTVMIKNMDKYSRWSVHAMHPTLDTFIKDNIVLVGDAAHGMMPHLGAGFGQGCEDAYFLTSLLMHRSATKEKLPAILALYDKYRRPRANKVLEMSTETGRMYDSYGRDGYNKQQLENLLQGRWDYVWYYDTDKDIATAIEELQTPS